MAWAGVGARPRRDGFSRGQPEGAHPPHPLDVHFLPALQELQAAGAAAALRLDERRRRGGALHGPRRPVALHPRRDVDRVTVQRVLAAAVRPHHVPAHCPAVHPSQQPHCPRSRLLRVDGGRGCNADRRKGKVGADRTAWSAGCWMQKLPGYAWPISS